MQEIEGIPIFSIKDSYIDNYEKISCDHVSHMKKGLGNPFMDEKHWALNEMITADLIKKHTEGRKKILDVGVGLGRLLANFPGLDRYGVDISMHYLRIAKEKGIKVCLARIEEMPYHDNFFDIVVCTDVLEHVIDLNYCVNKILCTLKAGGILVIRTPYKEPLEHYLAPEYPYQLAHLRNFDEFGLRLLFEKIFNCEFLGIEYGDSSISDGRLKYILPLFKWKSFVRKSVRLLNYITKKGANLLKRKLYYPVEINILFKKRR